MRRLLILMVLVAACGIGALFYVTRASRVSSEADRTTVLSAADGAVFTWPSDQSWTWSFPLPQPTTGEVAVGLWFRERATPLSGKDMPAMGIAQKPMTREQAGREFGTSWLILSPTTEHSKSGHATVQLIDLKEVGAASSKPGQTLRVLGRLTVGPGETRLSGEDIYLPAGHFAGTTRTHGGQWVNGELNLMTFYVRGEGQQWQYDVVLVQKRPE